MTKGKSSDDPKGLIYESYRIEGITVGECRSIFLDWALSVPMGTDQQSLIKNLLSQYGEASDHPMSQVLKEGLAAAPATGRRGGRAARIGRS